MGNTGKQQNDYVKQLNDHLAGKTIKEIKPLGKLDLKSLDWEGEEVLAIYFTDGNYMVAAQDPEGNGPGAIFTTVKHAEVIA